MRPYYIHIGYNVNALSGTYVPRLVYIGPMDDVTIREVRNLRRRRVGPRDRGETLTVTRDGRAVAVYTCNPDDFSGIDELEVVAVPFR